MLGERAVMKRVLILDSTTRTGSRTASLMDAFCSGLDPECVYTELLRLSEQNLKPLYGESLQERDRLLAEGNRTAERFRYAWQFRSADVIVIAAPFYDLSIPALLKDYIENITVEGITFSSSETGLKGECKASEMIFLTTRGGLVETGSEWELATPYLKGLCGMLGIDHFSCIAADGMDVQGIDTAARLEKASAEAKKKASEIR